MSRIETVGNGQTTARVVLTDGAIRNGYLRFPRDLECFAGSPSSQREIILDLDGYGEVDGSVDSERGVFRWRGWKKFFRLHQLKGNDAVLFSQVAADRLRVAPATNRLIPDDGLPSHGAASGDSSPAKARPRRRVAAEKRCNSLDGTKWLQFSISVWSDIRKSTEELRLKHPAMFPVALVDRLMQTFLRPDGRVVLDPFMGSGSTLVGAREAGKHGIGFELSPEYIELARRRLERTSFDGKSGSFEIRQGDARQLVETLAADSVDLCVTSPPYWNILNQDRTADSKATRHYGNLRGDLGTIASYDEFLDLLGDIFVGVLRALRPGAYCCVNVMDLRKQDRFFPLHSDLARELAVRGFVFDDLIIWNRGQEYNNLRPLGYPYTFRINKVHEYVVILRKPTK
jgi:DNA modification methylase